jgi:hypothetical protein
MESSCRAAAYLQAEHEDFLRNEEKKRRVMEPSSPAAACIRAESADLQYEDSFTVRNDAQRDHRIFLREGAHAEFSGNPFKKQGAPASEVLTKPKRSKLDARLGKVWLSAADVNIIKPHAPTATSVPSNGPANVHHCEGSKRNGSHDYGCEVAHHSQGCQFRQHCHVEVGDCITKCFAGSWGHSVCYQTIFDNDRQHRPNHCQQWLPCLCRPKPRRPCKCHCKCKKASYEGDCKFRKGCKIKERDCICAPDRKSWGHVKCHGGSVRSNHRFGNDIALRLVYGF